MTRKLMLLFAAALALVAPACTAARAAQLMPSDRAWIGTCMDQLKLDNANRKTVRKYCVCMHGYFEDNEKVSQSDMEHMFPPAHRLCNEQAGWKQQR